jgi:hypothetical protein
VSRQAKVWREAPAPPKNARQIRRAHWNRGIRRVIHSQTHRLTQANPREIHEVAWEFGYSG